MSFHLIDIQNWRRREFYEHFMQEVVCSYSAFNINVYDKGKYMFPIFTLGKFYEDNGKRLLPLSIQVHHSVCDGYHVGKFVETLQTLIDNFDICKENVSMLKVKTNIKKQKGVVTGC